MQPSWGSFRTMGGTVSVGPQAIHIDRTPRSFVAGLLAGWHSGGLTRRLTVAYRLVFLGLVPIVAIFQFARVLELSSWLAVAAGVSWIAFTLVPLVVRYREQSIDRSAIIDVSYDADARTLTVEHEPETGWQARLARWFGRDSNPLGSTPRTTTFGLPGADDVREARTSLRTAGIVDDFESTTAPATVTRHRVKTVRGVVFCEVCTRQVSPADRSCPTCSTALRVEQPVE